MATVHNIYKEVFAHAIFVYLFIYFWLKKGKGNYIKEYIMKMSNLASNLKALKLKLGEDLLVHLVLISLPACFGQFKLSYKT